ncbi:hypothetical protein AVEN_257937-1 [Araneus ventricosus]|uniref:Uncharacterized protein n=1 Tax=Araneus ventricosus TaxID=182803 RepID=A0A4Y2A7Y0_ARAVE|nr:hypothetical protein AVEN_257937-1 [Araneus ventricosus]
MRAAERLTSRLRGLRGLFWYPGWVGFRTLTTEPILTGSTRIDILNQKNIVACGNEILTCVCYSSCKDPDSKVKAYLGYNSCVLKEKVNKQFAPCFLCLHYFFSESFTA